MKKRTTHFFILAALLMLCLSHAAADAWNLYLPEELTEIGESAFAGDTSLDSVYVGDKVEIIGAQAFANSSLRDIRLPESLTEVAPDAFRNVPHVEIFGTWNPDFFDGMDNVSKAGTALKPYGSSSVPVAAGQEVLRSVTLTMTGEWYFAVENCSSAVLYNSNGEAIDDFTFDSEEGSLYYTYTSSETEEVYLGIRNDTDALNIAEVTIKSPFEVTELISVQQAEYKSSSSIVYLYRTAPEFPLEELEPHQYYAPAIRTEFSGESADFEIDLYVDNIRIKHWEDTLYTSSDETEIYDFVLEPEDVMKFGGFDAGEHAVRFEFNGTDIEYTYALTGNRKPQSIGQDASSLYLLPDQHVFASFTADKDGEYTFQSDIPAALRIYGRLIDEEGNILDCKEEDSEEYDFCLSANLTEGQTITLEAWLASQADKKSAFYGVVAVIVNEPSADGVDIFENATCRALVIGQTYEHSPEWISRLDGCRNDADGMATVLANLAGTPYTVSWQMNLTAAEILSEISSVFAGATEDDVSLFYYSGHGATGSGALVGSDGDDVTPEELRAALDAVPGTKIIILDSCFSGYLIGRNPGEEATAQAAIDHFLSVFSYTGRGEGREYYVLTASSQYETSIGYKGYSSLFTGCLLYGMGYDADDNVWLGNAPADTDHDGMFTLDELFVYCRKSIRDIKLGQTVCPWPYNCNQVLFIDRNPD